VTSIAPDPSRDLPHGRAARFLTRVLEHAGDTLVGEGRVPDGAVYARGGRCPTFVLLELGAQAAALLEAPAGAPAAAAPRAGYLVRARGVRCARLEFDVDRTLRVEARRKGSHAPLFVYDIRVSDGTGELLAGELSILAASG
jgi:predicted hotdog family 3-hydroxylacyl-ACP dehydratase